MAVYQGAGTDDRTLIRCIVTRAEVDMVQIKSEFQKMYHQSLEQFIQVSIHHLVVSHIVFIIS